jgi:predicted  nucleic acid-binding Zn-ribbon protein
LDDKPAPKSSKPLEVKKIKNKISIINSKIREIKLKPNNTPSQILRNKNNINDLKFKKKELQKMIAN